MATRKTRLNTDSPTSTSGSEATAPSTPTSAVQKRITRKMLDAKSAAADAETAAVAPPPLPPPAAAVAPVAIVSTEQVSPVRKRTALTKIASKDELLATAAPGKTDDDGHHSTTLESASDSGSLHAAADPQIPADEDQSAGDDDDDATTTTEQTDAEAAPTDTTSPASTPQPKSAAAKRKRTSRQSLRKVSTGRVGRPPRKSLPTTLKQDLMRRSGTGRAELVKAAAAAAAAASAAIVTAAAVVASDRKQQPARQTRGEQNLRSSRARQSTTNATAAAAAATSPERAVRVSRKRARTTTTTVKKEVVDAEEEEEEEEATASSGNAAASDATVAEAPDADAEAGDAADEEIAANDDDDAEKPPAKLIKTEVSDEETSVGVDAAAPKTDADIQRRRSNSESKCSDTSSNMDVPLQVLKDDAIALVPIKEEPKDESDSVLHASPVTIAAAAIGQVARRSTPLNDDSGIVVSKTPSPVTVAATRPKRSLTRPKLAASASPVPSDEPSAAAKVEATLPLVVLPIATTTTLLTVPSTTATNSPSPVSVPASEGVSPISVKAFYGQPDFLENNLGIEKDPKLRDIVVQQQHQDKTVTATTTKDDAADNNDVDDDDASMEEPLRYEGSIDEDEVDNVKVADDIPATPMECDDKAMDVINGEKPVDVDAKPEEKTSTVDELKLDPNTAPIVVASAIDNDNLIKPKLETAKPAADVAEDADDKENAALCNVKPHTSPNRSPLGAAMAEPQTVPAPSISSSVLSVTTGAAVPMLVPESPDALRRKESHFLKLGLLTHEAAVAAKIEQERQRDALQSMHTLAANVAATTAATLANIAGAGNSSGNGTGGKAAKKSAAAAAATGSGSEYTGTLKTVIKLHRPSTSGEQLGNATTGAVPPAKKKPGRQAGGALKMTLHKGRGKGGVGAAGSSASGQAGGSGGSGSHSDHSGAGSAAGDEETYYTIHSEAGDGHADAAVHDGVEPLETKETEKALVIPEKASSFRIHPDKLCQDQCFYCGGKFGLFDTPCHVAGIKSQERQRKILDNEEKLTVDNCLCDACFRHVDRRANCPIYKKRTTNTATANSEYSKMLKAAGLDDSTPGGGVTITTVASAPSLSTTLDDCTSQPMDIESPLVVAGGADVDSMTASCGAQAPPHQHHGQMCQVSACGSLSAHSIRRKWFMKMRKQIGKLLNLNADAGTIGGGMLAICGQHYNVIGHLMVCTLCKRKLVRNHIYYINQNIAKLEELLAAQGLPMTIGQSPIVCKLCRYFSNLLLKPPEKSQKVKFVKEYRRRLLQFFNVDVLDETDESQSAHDNPQQPAQLQPANQAIMQPAQHPYPAIAQRKSRTSKGSRKSSRGDDSSMSLPSSVEPVHAYRDSADTPPPAQPHASSSASNQIPTTAELLAEYDQSPSITIVPRPKSTTAATPSSTKKQIIVVETGHHSPTGSAHPTKEDLSALRANPNISMRELFPGEEDLGLHVNMPFGTVSQRTPEGWSKNQMTVQYDEQTRHLWEELQKPYGNQSSFMRHLILLEKYFRNGDLVLVAGASGSAQTYADSVQQRLSSYDNRPATTAATTVTLATATSNAATTSLSALANSLFSPNIYNKSPAAANVSITPAVPKSAGKSTASSCSLLKPKQRMSDGGGSGSVDKASAKDKQSVTLPPELICINTSNKQHMSITQSLQQYSQKNAAAAAVSANTSSMSTQSSANVSPVSPTLAHSGTEHAGRHQSQKQHHDSMLNQPSTSATSAPTSGKQRKQNSSFPGSHNNSGSSKPSTSAAAAAADAASAAVAAAAAAAGKSSAATSSASSAACDANVIRLPDVLTAEERLESQMWRPTLMPVSAAPAALNGQMYQTADGRKLPNLVQVQSGGNPYLISIHDYNRMCILRRERLLRDQVIQRQQQQHQQPPQHQQQHQQQQQQHHQHHQQMPGSASANNHGSSQQQPLSNSTSPGLAQAQASSTPKAANNNATTGGMSSSSKANRSAGGSAMSAANQKVQIPNKILEQNSLIPLANHGHNPHHGVHAGLSGSGGKSGSSTNALDSLLKTRKPNPTSLLKQNHQGKSSGGSNSGSSSNVVSITSTPSIAAILGVNPPSASSLQQQQQQMLQNQQMMQNQQIIQQQFLQQQLAYQTMNNNIGMGGRGGGQHIVPNVTATLHGPSGVGPLDALIKAASQNMGGGNNNNGGGGVGGPSASSIPNNIRMWAEALSRSAAVASGLSNASDHDNAAAAASLLSKIPKSLTVIPQQKESSSGSTSSHSRRSTKASMLGLDGTM